MSEEQARTIERGARGPSGPQCAATRCRRGIYALNSQDGLVWKHLDPQFDGAHPCHPYDPYPYE